MRINRNVIGFLVVGFLSAIVGSILKDFGIYPQTSGLFMAASVISCAIAFYLSIGFFE